MHKILTNHDIPTELWQNQFSRDELRVIAKKHGIKVGRDKIDAAIYIKLGTCQNGTIATFTVDLFIQGIQANV
jgi:hypothetical protein